MGTTPGGNTSPYAETDYLWDAGFTHQFTSHLAYAQDNYFRLDRHYLDEGQFGFVPIDAPFNYVRGYGGGTENSLTYSPENFALRANLFVAREEDIGVAPGSTIFRLMSLRTSTAIISCSITRRWSVLPAAQLSMERVPVHFDGLFSSGLRGGFANKRSFRKYGSSI